MIPTPGRIVSYVLSPEDCGIVNERLHNDPLTRGNHAHTGHVYPMLIVRVWDSGLVNGQVFVDGNYSYWATSRERNDDRAWGTWFWPERV